MHRFALRLKPANHKVRSIAASCVAALNGAAPAVQFKSHMSLSRNITSVSTRYPDYHAQHTRSIENPIEFWEEAAKNIAWFKPPTKILDDTNSPYLRWFTDGELNLSYAALDANIAKGRGDQIAITHYNAYDEADSQSFTYNQTLKEVERIAGAMKARGIGKGDFVLIYMPMVPEAVFTMLACARIGAIHSVVFGGFAAVELKKRIDACKPKLIVTASCGLEPKGKVIDYKHLLDHALEISEHQVPSVVILQRKYLPTPEKDFKAGRDLEWNEFLNTGTPVKDPVVMKSTDTSYVLYTSGTTGAPKGVVRDVGGYAVALKHSMKNVFAMNEGENWFAGSDIGWVVGHSYIVYGPLLHGCSTILFEGKPIMTPDAATYWRILTKHKINGFFTAPTALRAIKKEDPELELLKPFKDDIQKNLRAVFVAGERADPDTVKWAYRGLGVPLIDHYWQTETGWPIIGPALPLDRWDVKPGSAGVPLAGYNVQILDDNGERITTPNTNGNIVVKLPLPPGALLGLYNAHERFMKGYYSRFPGYYDTADAGFFDEDGYVHVMARTDDVMNVAGHRLSTGAIEEAVATHGEVAECCVVACPDPIKGSLPLVFAILKGSQERSEEQLAQVEKEIVLTIRETVGAVATPRKCLFVHRLPKTRSGKIQRVTIRQILKYVEDEINSVPNLPAFEVAVPPPATIEDPAVLGEIREAITKADLFQKQP